MGIDVHVGDAFKSGTAAQELDRDSAIVEDAETRRMVAAGVVQACNRHKSPAAAAVHNGIDGVERGADHIGRGLVHATKRRGVPRVEIALAAARALANKINVSRRMEAQ
jgi:hypothetical protein